MKERSLVILLTKYGESSDCYPTVQDKTKLLVLYQRIGVYKDQKSDGFTELLS